MLLSPDQVEDCITAGGWLWHDICLILYKTLSFLVASCKFMHDLES